MPRASDPKADITVAVLCRSAPPIIARALTSVGRQTLPSAAILLVPAPGAGAAELGLLARRFGAEVCAPEVCGDAPFGLTWLSGVQTRWVALLRDVDEYYPARLAVGAHELQSSGLDLLGAGIHPVEGRRVDAPSGGPGGGAPSDMLAGAIAAAVDGRRRTSLSTLIAAKSMFGASLAGQFGAEAHDGLTSVLEMVLGAGGRGGLSPHGLVLHRCDGELSSGPLEAALIADSRVARLIAKLAAHADMERLQSVLEHLCGEPLSPVLGRPDLLANAAARLPTAGNGRVAVELLRAALPLACAHREYALRVAAWRADLAAAFQTHLTLMERALNAGPAAEAALRAQAQEARGGWRGWLPARLSGPAPRRIHVRGEQTPMTVTHDLGASYSDALLGQGWSAAEGWGRWTDGPLAYMELPWPPWRPDHIVLIARQVFDTAATTGLAYVSLDGGPEIEVRFFPPDAVTMSLPPSSTGSTTVVLRPAGYKSRLQAPREETRRLGIGLEAVSLQRHAHRRKGRA